jgi:hypothetical protein
MVFQTEFRIIEPLRYSEQRGFRKSAACSRLGVELSRKLVKLRQ